MRLVVEFQALKKEYLDTNGQFELKGCGYYNSQWSNSTVKRPFKIVT